MTNRLSYCEVAAGLQTLKKNKDGKIVLPNKIYPKKEIAIREYCFCGKKCKLIEPIRYYSCKGDLKALTLLPIECFTQVDIKGIAEALGYRMFEYAMWRAEDEDEYSYKNRHRNKKQIRRKNKSLVIKRTVTSSGWIVTEHGFSEDETNVFRCTHYLKKFEALLKSTMEAELQTILCSNTSDIVISYILS